jgi:predicted transposase YbfD/YdcC
MYSTALLVTLPRLTDQQRRDLLREAALLSLHDAFAAVPDPRSCHGRRYDLPFLLTCFVAALLCNCNHSEAVGQWCRAQHRLLRRLFGSRRFVCPTGALYRWLFPQLQVQALEAVLATWVQATLVATPDEPVAVDGKTVRGARTSTQGAPHLLSFCTHVSHETLLQVAVDEKTNEIPVAQALVPLLPLRGRVCTADALHTQVEFMRVLHEEQAETVLTVKENQPSLLADLMTYFADPAARYQQAATWDRHRGRTEVRCLKVSSEMSAYLAPAWPYVAQVAQLTRTVTEPGQIRSEVVYLITSLTPAQATPQRLLELIRGHWHIENGLHYVRDVTFGEDRSRIRTGNAPQVMASLRNLAITLIHRTGSTHIAASRRDLAFHPHQALNLLLHRRHLQ